MDKKMKQTLIKITDDHYVVVDNSEIKEGDWYLIGRTIHHCLKNIPEDLCNENKIFKITHSTKPLELLSENGLSGMGFSKVRPLNIFEVKELIGEVDVEKMGYNESFRRDVLYNQHSTIGEQNAFIDGTKYGYNQAIEDNKERKYTEEDLKIAITQAFLSGVERLEDFERVERMIFENIQPKTEWDVQIVDGKLKLI